MPTAIIATTGRALRGSTPCEQRERVLDARQLEVCGRLVVSLGHRRSHLYLATGRDGAAREVDRERDDEEHQAGGDQHVDVGADALPNWRAMFAAIVRCPSRTG